MRFWVFCFQRKKERVIFLKVCLCIFIKMIRVAEGIRQNGIRRWIKITDYVFWWGRNLNNCLFWEQKRRFWLTTNGWMITPASWWRHRTSVDRKRIEWESEETGEEEVWTIASSQEGCDHFCLSSHFSLMHSHESITNSDSESPNESLNVCKLIVKF